MDEELRLHYQPPWHRICASGHLLHVPGCMSFESVMYTGCGRPSVRPASGQLECSRKKATANGILKITPGGRQRSLNLIHSRDKSVVCESLSVRGDNLKSGWSRGLRRYVQVVVHFVGVGSNPTSDKLFCRFSLDHLVFQKTIF